MRMKPYTLMLALATMAGCSAHPIKGSKNPMMAAKECSSTLSSSFVKDGHLYTTLSIADIANYDNTRKMTLAYYSQYPDIDPDFEAVPVSIKYLVTPWKWSWRNDITGTLHSLHGGKRDHIDDRRETIRNVLTKSLQNPELDWLSGLIIHAYGDSFAHTSGQFNAKNEKAYGKWIGHLFPTLFGNSPDNIKSETTEPKYMAYATSLYRDIKTDTQNDQEFIKFLTFVDNLECKGGLCPNLHEAFNGNHPSKDSPMDTFTQCMNDHARPLTTSEVQHAMNLIKGEEK